MSEENGDPWYKSFTMAQAVRLFYLFAAGGLGWYFLHIGWTEQSQSLFVALSGIILHRMGGDKI
jgi:hypothetical protein